PTGSVKDRIARYMIEKAEAESKLKPGHTILEATSGNTGISLAMIGRLKGYPVKVVMPKNVSAERIQLLQLYGAEIVFSDSTKGTNGAVEVARELADDEQYFMPDQYGNEANPRAHYETTAVEILEKVPRVDTFVAGLGTGGTLMGVGKRLKEENPETRVVAIEPHPEEIVDGLRNLSDGFIPPIIDLGMLNGKIVVRSRDAVLSTRELCEKEGLFVGVSSGAVARCAARLSERMDSGIIVALFADGGWKYLSTGLWTRNISELKDNLEHMLWW
ncbi:MAG: cysteine synthase family protein, partial [Actinomycetota bacterium]